MIHFRVNVWSKSMLRVTSSKKSCMIEVMFTIIEFISFFIQSTKGIYIGIRKFATELWPLIHVRIWFLLNILRTN